MNPLSFNRQSYQKQKGSGTSEQLLFRLQNKFKHIPLFVTYYLTKFDDIMWSSFSVTPKLTSANLCKSIHGIINYSSSISPFESGKCGKEGKRLEKFKYLENEKSFLDEIKSISHSFYRAVNWWENKNLRKKYRTQALTVLLLQWKLSWSDPRLYSTGSCPLMPKWVPV